MGNEEKAALGDKMIQHFSNIKGFCDSAIAFVSGAEKDEIDVFGLTERIQEEIEEIRDLWFA